MLHGYLSSFFFLFFLQSTIIYLSTFHQAAVIYIYLKIVCAFFPPIHSMKEMFNLVHVVVMYLLLLFLHQISYLAVTKLVIYLFKACFFFISLILFVDIFKFKLSWHHLSFVLAIVTVQHFKQPDFTVESDVLNCQHIKSEYTLNVHPSVIKPFSLRWMSKNDYIIYFSHPIVPPNCCTSTQVQLWGVGKRGLVL